MAEQPLEQGSAQTAEQQTGSPEDSPSVLRHARTPGETDVDDALGRSDDPDQPR